MIGIIKKEALFVFWQRLSKREKFVFAGAACVVCVTIFDRLILSPITSKIKALNEAIGKKEADIKKDMRIVSQKSKIISAGARYAPFIASPRSKEEETSVILKEIESLANKSSVYLVDIKPLAVKELGTSREYAVSLNCEAQMEQLADFMYNIENSNKFLLIERYQISPKTKESSVARCSMTVSKMTVL